jgi:hypothetical protein
MTTLQWNNRDCIGKKMLNFYWIPNKTLKYQSKRKKKSEGTSENNGMIMFRNKCNRSRQA